MGQVLKGKRLNDVIELLEGGVKQNVDNEAMDYLACLNYIVKRNWQFHFGEIYKGKASGMLLDHDEALVSAMLTVFIFFSAFGLAGIVLYQLFSGNI